MNVIDIFTRKVISPNPRMLEISNMDAPKQLKELLSRLSIDLDNNSDKMMYNATLRFQDERLGPYIGDCTHQTHPKRFHELRFPVPNYNASPRKVLGRGIIQGTECDPFAFLEKKYCATKRIMKHARKIYTRSDLIAHDDYISEISMSAEILFIYNENELDEETGFEWAHDNLPGAPSHKRRVKACQKLNSLGFNARMILDTDVE